MVHCFAQALDPSPPFPHLKKALDGLPPYKTFILGGRGQRSLPRFGTRTHVRVRLPAIFAKMTGAAHPPPDPPPQEGSGMVWVLEFMG